MDEKILQQMGLYFVEVESMGLGNMAETKKGLLAIELCSFDFELPVDFISHFPQKYFISDIRNIVFNNLLDS